MNRIDRKTMARLGEISAEVQAAYDVISVKLAEWQGLINDEIAKADELRSEAFDLMDDVANSACEYYDEKSEKWQEGERGQAYGEWRDRLDAIRDDLSEALEAPELPTEADRPDWFSDLENGDFEEFQP